MKDRMMLASTDPEDDGAEWVSSLKGYFYIGSGAINPEEYEDIGGGRILTPEGEIIGYDELDDLGITEYNEDFGFIVQFDNMSYEFDKADYGYVGTGYAGLWDGMHAGGRLIEDSQDLSSLISGYDDVRIEDDGGELVVSMYHHDGTNRLTLRALTKKGRDWYDDNYYELSDRELMETLFNNPQYSEPPHLADKIYGSVATKNVKSRKKARRQSKKRTQVKRRRT